MRKLWNVFMISVTLTSMLRCQTTWADSKSLNLSPRQITISRDQEEQFVICFEQLMNCKQTVKTLSQPPATDWETLSILVLSGFVAGLLLESQLKK